MRNPFLDLLKDRLGQPYTEPGKGTGAAAEKPGKAAAEVSPSLTPNDVHLQQATLKSRFSNGSAGQKKDTASSEPPDDHELFSRCLEPLLEALNWAGDRSRIADALPYLDGLSHHIEFISVLHHLGYENTETVLRYSDIEKDHVPCLLLSDTGAPEIISRVTDDNRLVVYDPAADETTVRERTHASATVYAFFGKDAATAAARRKSWFSDTFFQMKQAIIAITVLSFLANSLSLVLPLYVMTVYNYVIGTRSIDTLVFLAAGILVIFGFEFGFRRARSRIIAYCAARLTTGVSAVAFARLLHLPIIMTETASIGAQIARFRQFDGLKDFFTGHLASTLFDLPFTVLFIGVIIIVGGPLAWIPVGLIALMALLTTLTYPVGQRLTKNGADSRSRLQAFQIDMLNQARTIRDLGAQPLFSERYRKHLKVASRAKYAAGTFNFALHAASQALVMSAGAATLIIGALMVIDGTMTTGALIAVMMFVWRVLTPIQVAFLSVNRLGQFYATVRQIDRLVDLPAEIEERDHISVRRNFKGHFQIESLMFRYSPQTEPVLRGVNLNIPTGQAVALVGSAGSGRRTLLKHMIGLYRAQSGTILLDGIDIRQIDIRELRRSVGYVSKRVDLFHGTLQQNILLAAPTAADTDIERALSLAGIDLDPEMFPQGISTRLSGKDWKKLDPGLLSQINLARTYAKKPPIFIMDDPGAYLDRAADERFINWIKSAKGDATIVISTNRPAHMKACDRVLYMHNGTIAADGPPEEMVPKIMAHNEKNRAGKN